MTLTMTRRKKKGLAEQADSFRRLRINKLIALGWITSEAEIPEDAIPVDPYLLNLGYSWEKPTCFRAQTFRCIDCGLAQLWKAEDQQWYYETTGAYFFSTAKRCLPCRKKEQERKRLARIAAGHEKS